MTETVALIVAAGRGVRAGGDLPKQYRSIGGIPILRRSIDVFLTHPAIDRVLVVVAPDDARYDDVAPQNSDRLLPAAKGGENRQDSVRAGLRVLSSRNPGRVLIHDAARPFATADLIGRVVSALDGADAVIPALPVPRP